MEQPPAGIDPYLRAFLSRLDLRLDQAISASGSVQKYTVLPDKPIIGKIYYFSNTVGATITQEGYWGYTSSGWVLLG